MSCLETPGPPGPKGHRGQKVSFKHTHTHKHIHTQYVILVTVILTDYRELKETTAIQVSKEKEVVQETLVLRVPSVSPVSK